MRKFFSYLLLSGLFLLPSCGTTDNENLLPEENNGEEAGIGEGDTPDITAEDILVVYFSRAGENWNVGYVEQGNTAIMAGYIREYTGGTAYEIVPEVPYPTDYTFMLEIAREEINTDARPAIKNPLENLERYSVVFIGSPVWHGQPPMIMHTFYEAYPELKDKTLVPFGTHGGSGISSCVNLMREYFPGTDMLESFGVSGDRIRNSRSEVEEWLHKIGMVRQETE